MFSKLRKKLELEIKKLFIKTIREVLKNSVLVFKYTVKQGLLMKYKKDHQGNKVTDL